MRYVLPLVLAFTLSLFGQAQAASTFSSLPAAVQPIGNSGTAGPTYVPMDQGAGCPNTTPCATVQSDALRLGQPIQANNCVAVVGAPFQYQQCIDTSTSPPVQKEFIGTTWWPIVTLNPTAPGPIQINTAAPPVKALTSPYTVATTDCGSQLSSAGGTFYQVTFPAAGGFPSGCAITISNDDPFPGRGKTISIPGYSPQILYSGQTLKVTDIGSAWSPSQVMPQRWSINPQGGTGNLAFFVSIGGSNFNDGLGGCGGAGTSATPGFAYDFISQNVNLRGDN